MAKSVQMTIKVERELRDEFSRYAAEQKCPASQMIREFMRSAVLRSGEPNAETIAAIDDLKNGGGKRFSSLDDLCHDLGIPCEK